MTLLMLQLGIIAIMRALKKADLPITRRNCSSAYMKIYTYAHYHLPRYFQPKVAPVEYVIIFSMGRGFHCWKVVGDTPVSSFVYNYYFFCFPVCLMFISRLISDLPVSQRKKIHAVFFSFVSSGMITNRTTEHQRSNLIYTF